MPLYVFFLRITRFRSSQDPNQGRSQYFTKAESSLLSPWSRKPEELVSRREVFGLKLCAHIYVDIAVLPTELFAWTGQKGIR